MKTIYYVLLIIVLLTFKIEIKDKKCKIKRTKPEDRHIVLICLLIWILSSKLA